MTNELKQKWEQFLSGHWQKEQPQREGDFFTADGRGEQSGPRVVFRDPNTGVHRQVPGREWGAWWWSEPLPELPAPPKWEGS